MTHKIDNCSKKEKRMFLQKTSRIKSKDIFIALTYWPISYMSYKYTC